MKPKVNNSSTADKPLSDQSDEAELAKLEKEANEAAAKEIAAGGESETPSSESAPEGKETTSKEGETESEEAKPEGEAEPETKVEGEEKPEGEPSAEEEEPEDEGVPENLSPKGQKRFKKLAEKAKKVDELTEEIERLKGLIGTPKVPDLVITNPTTGKKPGEAGGLPWDSKEGAEGGEEGITLSDLDKRIDQKTQERLGKIAQFNQFTTDVESVETDYPELKLGNEGFDKKLADTISKYYESVALIRIGPSRDNPQGGLMFRPGAPTFRAFVDDIMSVRAKAAEDGKTLVTKKVLKQAAQQPVTPTGSEAPSESSVEAKIRDPHTSLEEAEALANKAVKS